MSPVDCSIHDFGSLTGYDGENDFKVFGVFVHPYRFVLRFKYGVSPWQISERTTRLITYPRYRLISKLLSRDHPVHSPRCLQIIVVDPEDHIVVGLDEDIGGRTAESFADSRRIWSRVEGQSYEFLS